MKATIAMCCVLLAGSYARGQFNIVAEDRSVFAEAHYTIFDPPDTIVRDSQSASAEALMPFSTTVTAMTDISIATASQTSAISTSELFATGTVFDNFLDAFGVGAHSWSRFSVDFTVSETVNALLHYEILDPGYRIGFPYQYADDVSFSLTGPNISHVVPPNGDDVPDPPPLNRFDPIVVDQFMTLVPGSYSLMAEATSIGQSGHPLDVYYVVSVTAIPIPEPDSLLLLLVALALPLWKMAKIKRRR